MTDASYQKAHEEAVSFLKSYSIWIPTPPPTTSTPNLLDILEALAEAQKVLQMTSRTALQKKTDFLIQARKKQLAVNVLHFVTGSGFVALIALNNPSAVKWDGAAISLIAGIIALTLPKDLGTLERNIKMDIDTISALTGEIAELQIRMQFPQSAELYERIAKSIAACRRIATKYDLDKLVASANNNVHGLLNTEALKTLGVSSTPKNDNAKHES
jgi:hypothetical protein